MLTEEIHIVTFKKYYANLIIKEKVVGPVSSKILSLVIGVKGRDVSLYQLMIGYIPKMRSYPNGIQYYSNTYFVGCFQSRGFETIPKRCFPTDIENVITDNMSYRDRYTISDWLNSINIEEEIQNDQVEYEFLWSSDQYKKYLDSIHEE